MNITELRQAFRRDADDRSEPFLWSDTDLLAWFNEAQREACLRARLLACCETLPIHKSEYAVMLPPLLFEVRFAAIYAQGAMRRQLVQLDDYERERQYPHWRSSVGCADAFVHCGPAIELNAIPDRNYQLRVRGFRLPQTMLNDGDVPEINLVHHERLLYWAMHRAYSVPDKEMFDPNRAAEQEARFEYYFGRRPKASLRKLQSANHPHYNKCWW